MPGKIEALGILLLLLPGFLCAYIAQRLAARRDRTELDKVVQALIFSFVLYMATWPLFGYTLPLTWTMQSEGSLQISVHYAHLAVLFLLSVLLGIAYAANINYDWLLTLFRKLHITERTARSSIWNDTFLSAGGFVQVDMKDGRRVTGWVRDYSDDATDCSIFLEDAAWILQDGNEVVIDGPGILLTKESVIQSVAFLNWTIDPSKSMEESEEA
jgi:hypothetical protein